MKIGDNKAAGEITLRAARQTYREANSLYYLVLSGFFNNPIKVTVTLCGKEYDIRSEKEAREVLLKHRKLLMPEKQLYKVVADGLRNIFFHHCIEHDGKVEDIFRCSISKSFLESVFGEFTLPS